MITYISGDLFRSPAQTLVNTVNTVGVMGKGIALTFKKLYPDMFAKYQEVCEGDELKIGSLMLWRTNAKWVLNFPTKTQWKLPSKLEYIEEGLRTFKANWQRMGIASVAFPPLGCGNGELDFDKDVQPLMDRYLSDLSLAVYIYRPLPKGNVPEHRDIKLMKQWLQSEPQYMPSAEVWEELISLFANECTIDSLSGRATRTVQYQSENESIRVSSGKATQHINRDFVDHIWHILRKFGIATSRDAMAYSKAGRDVLAVMSHLPFVELVGVSEFYNESQPEFGIQLAPRNGAPFVREQELSLSL